MPIETSQNVGPSVSATRPISAIDARIVQTTGERPKVANKPAANTASSSMVATSQALDPGAAPVNTDRVSEIRHAIETNTYPLLPTKVADAIIAAGLLLRSAK